MCVDCLRWGWISRVVGFYGGGTLCVSQLPHEVWKNVSGLGRNGDPHPTSHTPVRVLLRQTPQWPTGADDMIPTRRIRWSALFLQVCLSLPGDVGSSSGFQTPHFILPARVSFSSRLAHFLVHGWVCAQVISSCLIVKMFNVLLFVNQVSTYY